MSRRQPYKRKMGYIPYEERQFYVDAVHRPEPEMGTLTELFIRLALERVAEARKHREDAALPSTLKPRAQQ